MEFEELEKEMAIDRGISTDELMMYLPVKKSTREMLRRLLGALNVEGENWDEQIAELCQRAFKASEIPGRKQAAKGRGGERYRYAIRRSTAYRIMRLHDELYPFKPWVSWDWLLTEMAAICDEHRHRRSYNAEHRD